MISNSDTRLASITFVRCVYAVRKKKKKEDISKNAKNNHFKLHNAAFELTINTGIKETKSIFGLESGSNH